MTTFIYALVDPFTDETRYIGKADKPERRFRQHLRETLRNPHKVSWIASLGRRQCRPILRILEEVTVEKWEEREQFWIGHFRDRGARLFNHCDGGLGVTMTPEIRAKIGAAAKGRPSPYKGCQCPPEVRAKISAATLGHKVSNEARAKISAAGKGRKLPPESIEKGAAKRRGRPMPPEVRARLSQVKSGVPASPALQAAVDQQKLRAWQAIGFAEIPELSCALCGCELKLQPARVKHSQSGKVYCCQSHQAQDVAKALRGKPRDPAIMKAMHDALRAKQAILREKAEDQIRTHPELTNARIGAIVGVSSQTVARVRQRILT